MKQTTPIGADGDPIDVYVGPDHSSQTVFVIDQLDADTGKFDEHKCMLSYANKAAALADYRKAFSDGKADARIGAVSEMSVAEFKDWVKSPASRKPVGKFANGGTVMPHKNRAIQTALDVARRAMGGRVKRAEGGPVDNGPAGTSEFDFDPRERNRHRMIASGMPDPNQSLLDFNRETLGNFGRQAMSLVPGLNSGIASYNAYNEGRPASAALHGAIGAAEVALPFALGRMALSPSGVAAPRASVPSSNAPLPPEGSTEAMLAELRRFSALGNAAPSTSARSQELLTRAETVLAQRQAAEAERATLERELTRRRNQALLALPPHRSGDAPIMYGSDGRRLAVVDDGRAPANWDYGQAQRFWEASSQFDRMRKPRRMDTVHANGGRVGYAEGGDVDPLVPGGLPPLPEEMFIRTPVNTLTGAEEGLEARQPIPAMNRNPADYTRALALALADPMQLPSAVTGAFSPETRDAWRAGYEGREESIDAASALTPWGTLTRGATAAATAIPRAFAALPRPAQAAAAGAGALTALPPDASPAGQAARDPRLTRIEKLETDIAKNQRALEKLGTTNLQSRTAREAASKPYNDAITIAQEEIKRLTTAMENETADVRRREQEATRAQDWANTPWSKAYPWLPYATTGAGIALGLYGANRIANRGVNNYNAAIDSLGNDWRAALTRTENARAPAARQQALSEANAIQSRIGEVNKPGMGMPIMAGIAGTELGMAAPTVLDYLGSRQLPADAPLRRSVNESLDPTNLDVLGRYLLGAGIGAASGKYVTSLANSRLRPPPELGPRTTSLNERYPAIESELASPPALPPARPSLPEASPVETPASRPALPAPEARAPTSREAAPSSESPPHHSHLQPREAGRFAGPPKKPRKSRNQTRDRDIETAPDHDSNSRLLTGRKSGGLVNAALDIARRYAFGGRAYATGGSVAGPIMGTDPGRADMKPVSVKSGSFVVSADIVSGLGEGNTGAGMAKLDELFGGSQAGRRYAAGGPAHDDVPIKISSGEYVIPPEGVAKVGGGDMQKGHVVLDKLMIKLRKQHVEHLKSLPPPAKG